MTVFWTFNGSRRDIIEKKYRQYLNTRKLVLPSFVRAQDWCTFTPRRLDDVLNLYRIAFTRDRIESMSSNGCLPVSFDWTEDPCGRHPRIYSLEYANQRLLDGLNCTLYDFADWAVFDEQNLLSLNIFLRVSHCRTKYVPVISERLMMEIETQVTWPTGEVNKSLLYGT